MKAKQLTQIVLSIIIVNLFIPLNIASAALGDTGRTTLGACEKENGNTYQTESFRIQFSDDTRNIETFLLTSDTWDSEGPEPITHPHFYGEDYFSGNPVAGVPVRLYMESYDPLLEDQYSFAISWKMDKVYLNDDNTIYLEEIPNAEEESYMIAHNSYSQDYIVDVDIKKPIRILSGSYFKISEKDDGIFTGKDDEIFLSMIYDGEKNYMKQKPDSEGKYGIKMNACDLDFKAKKAFESIDAKIILDIPLLYSGAIHNIIQKNSRDVIVREGSINENKYVVENVTATITINPEGIFFDNGFPDEGISSEEAAPVEEKSEIKKPIGFGGYGFEVPEKGEYKGLSTETELERTIVGITNFVLGFVASIAVIMLIYGGYLWIVDRGEDQLAEKSRKVIASAIIGILMIISAYTIVNTVIEMGDAYPDKCQYGIDVGGGTNFDVDCEFEGTAAITGGAGTLLGGLLGGQEGSTIGGLIGGLLGGG